MVASTEASTLQQAEGANLFELAREMQKQTEAGAPSAEPARRTDEEAPVYCPVTTTSRTRPFTVNDESVELR